MKKHKLLGSVAVVSFALTQIAPALACTIIKNLVNGRASATCPDGSGSGNLILNGSGNGAGSAFFASGTWRATTTGRDQYGFAVCNVFDYTLDSFGVTQNVSCPGATSLMVSIT